MGVKQLLRQALLSISSTAEHVNVSQRDMKALIALNYCYSLTTLNGFPPKISLKCLLLIEGHYEMKSSKSGI